MAKEMMLADLAKSFQPHSHKHQCNGCCTQVPKKKKKALYEIQKIFQGTRQKVI